MKVPLPVYITYMTAAALLIHKRISEASEAVVFVSAIRLKKEFGAGSCRCRLKDLLNGEKPVSKFVILLM